MRTWVNRLLQNEQAGLLLALILLCVIVVFEPRFLRRST